MNNKQLSPDNRRLYSILCYVNILWLIGLLTAREDETIKFHVNNGIILSILEYVVAIVFSILTNLPFIGWIFGIISFVLGVGILIVAIKGIIAASNGKEEPLFLIGDFVKNIKIIK